MVTAIGPLGTGGWGSALGALGGFGSQGFLVLSPLPVPLPVPGSSPSFQSSTLRRKRVYCPQKSRQSRRRISRPSC